MEVCCEQRGYCYFYIRHSVLFGSESALIAEHVYTYKDLDSGFRWLTVVPHIPNIQQGPGTARANKQVREKKVQRLNIAIL